MTPVVDEIGRCRWAGSASVRGSGRDVSASSASVGARVTHRHGHRGICPFSLYQGESRRPLGSNARAPSN